MAASAHTPPGSRHSAARMKRTSAERGTRPVRHEAVPAQQRLTVDIAERIPALAGESEQIEVVRLGVRVVVVAGLAVRCALVVAAGEALEHDRALAAPAQLPCRREAHDAAADDNNFIAHLDAGTIDAVDDTCQRFRKGCFIIRGIF